MSSADHFSSLKKWPSAVIISEPLPPSSANAYALSPRTSHRPNHCECPIAERLKPMKKSLTFLFLLVSAAQAAPLTTKTTLSCELGDDSYNSIVLTPSDETWPINDPTQGSISIDFNGFRFGGMLLGSYRFDSQQKLRFAVTSYGDPDTLTAGTISDITTEHPVLRVTKGAHFISKKNKDIPCVRK